MRPPAITVFLAAVLAAASAAPLAAQDLPRLMPDDLFRRNIGGPGEMDRRFPPHRVMDNIYYVGTASLASFLITTPEGHILVNSCFTRTVPLMQQSVEELGFDFEDIRIVLGSHAHGDHMQGDARVKELTGAQVMVMAEDVPLLQSGDADTPPAPVDRVLHDRETVTLGGETLRAHLTSGHTPGCTSWELDVQEGGRTYKVLINCSLGVNPNYQLYQNPENPTIVEQYRSSYAKMRALDIDVPLGSHPGIYNMQAKYERIGQTPNPFVDPEGYLYEIALNEQAMGLRLEEQRIAAGGR